MKTVRKVIYVDEAKCTGCGLCVTDCAEGALEVIGGKAKVVSETFCDGLGACIGSCPEDALTIVEREADEFSEAEVHHHLAARETAAAAAVPDPPPMACGCPSSMVRSFEAPKETPRTDDRLAPVSELTQWPIQLRLVPVEGPFYKGRDLVLLADCTAAAYPDVHRRLIKGNTIIMSCPKLDNAEESVSKLALIFKKNKIGKVNVAIMEVPCCSGLVRIVQAAMAMSGEKHPIEVTRIGIRGDLQDVSSVSL